MYLPVPPPSDSGPVNGRRPWYRSVRVWASHRPWHCAAAITAVTFVVASVLPIWKAVWFGSWEITAELATFWWMLNSLGVAMAKEPPSVVIRWFWWNAAQLGALVAVSLAVGRWLGRRVGA